MRVRLLVGCVSLLGALSACESSGAKSARDAGQLPLDAGLSVDAGDRDARTDTDADQIRVDAGPSADAGDGDARADTDPAGDVEDCLTDVSAPVAGFIEIQAFSSAERNVYIERAREPGQRSTVGETFPYDLKGVLITTADDAACVKRAADLRYEFGHHNWNEIWSVRTAKARYVVHETYSFENQDRPWVDTVEARALEDDALIWGPVALQEEGCRTLPYNLNPCLRRERIDMPPADWGSE